MESCWGGGENKVILIQSSLLRNCPKIPIFEIFINCYMNCKYDNDWYVLWKNSILSFDFVWIFSRYCLELQWDTLYLVSNSSEKPLAPKQNKVQIMLKLVVSIPIGFLLSVQQRSILKPETKEANPSTWELRTKMANGSSGLSFAWLNSPFKLHKTPWVQENLLGWHVFVWELGVGLGWGWCNLTPRSLLLLLPPDLLTEPS